ncbi:DUF2130 domain-containing protein [Chitinophagaceae bacterium MMS25-I14]
MSTTIVCPNCQHKFEPSDAMRDEIEKQLRNKMLDWQKRKEDEFRQKEAGFQQVLQQKENELSAAVEAERRKISTEIEQQLRKSISTDFENRLRMAEQSAADNEEKLKEARRKEMEFLQKEQALINKEAELELNLQRQLMTERERLKEQVSKEAADKMHLKESEYLMQMQELRKQLEDQKKLAEEMKRKAEQGSMQLQGEVQELALESLLRSSFPFDVVAEVGKGVRGADCIQTVRNSFGQECGKIIYESKRTKDFSPEWIEKLKADMRSLGADIAVIVTQAMPKDMDCFGEKDGVWICSFSEVRALSAILRDLVIKVSTAAKSQENKGDKMALLYTYLTSSEFSEQWKAIREGFMSMRISIQKERDAMERMWKAREKQLEKVLLNAAHIKGSIEGIAGMENNIDLTLTSDDSNYLLD